MPASNESATQKVLRPRKWTTKVNLAMAIGVLALLVFGVVLVWRMSADFSAAREEPGNASPPDNSVKPQPSTPP